MTKKLSLFLLGGFLLLLLGCRADEAMLPEQTEKYFQVFGKQDEASLDYAKGFRYLYENYDSIQKQKRRDYTPVSQVYSKRQGFSQKSSNVESEYIDFRFHSTAFKFDNGDVWVYYPVIKGDMVAKIAVATLIENRTQVYLRLLNPETDYYREVHQLFHTAYERHKAERNSKVSARGSNNECEAGCHEIEEVVIVEPVPIPKRGGGVLFVYNYDDMYSGGGNCGDFNNCWDGYSTGGGGGGSGSDINSDIDDGNNTDPCAKMKAQTNDAAYKEKRELLQKKTGGTYEVGFRVGLPVTYAGQVGTQYQKLENRAGTSELDFKIFKTTFGIMHTHYDGLYPMFSPGDIYLFGQLLTNAQNNNIPLNEVFLSLVTSAGNYQLRFDGAHFAGWNQNFDFNQLNKDYVKREYLGEYDKGTQEKFEQGFLKFMKDKMNIEGAKLIREGESGNTQLSLDHRGNLKTDDCK